MIVSLTGKADNFNLIFVKQPNNKWAAEVPPNIETGRYIVELCAVDAAGNIGYWRGVLLMSQNQRVSIDVMGEEYQTWLINDVKITVNERSVEVECLMEDVEITVNERSVEVCLKSDIEAEVTERYTVELTYKAV